MRRADKVVFDLVGASIDLIGSGWEGCWQRFETL